MTTRQLNIYLDIKDPNAYLALPGTLALLRDTQCSARWHPLQTPSARPPGPQPSPSADRGERHRWFRANYRERELAYYADVLNLPLAHPYQPAGSSAAANVILWLQDQGCAAQTLGELLLTLATQHFSNSHSRLNEAAFIAEQITNIGFNGAGFTQYISAEAEAAAALEDAVAAAATAGVSRGPAYLLADALYIGREHLPLLREQLTR